MNAYGYMSEPRRARSSDPITSHEAAEKASRFAGSHAQRILAALDEITSGTAQEIGRMTGLSVEQCCRRLVELQRSGQIAVVTFEDGRELHRDGYRVWRLA